MNVFARERRALPGVRGRGAGAHGRSYGREPAECERVQAPAGLHVRSEQSVVGRSTIGRLPSGCRRPNAAPAASGDPHRLRPMRILTSSSRARSASGADGIARIPDRARSPLEGDAYKDDTLERLPASLSEAVERFEQERLLQGCVRRDFRGDPRASRPPRRGCLPATTLRIWERHRYLAPSKPRGGYPMTHCIDGRSGRQVIMPPDHPGTSEAEGDTMGDRQASVIGGSSWTGGGSWRSRERGRPRRVVRGLRPRKRLLDGYQRPPPRVPRANCRPWAGR